MADSAPDGSQKADEHSVPVVADSDSDSDSAISTAAAEVDSASAAETCRPLPSSGPASTASAKPVNLLGHQVSFTAWHSAAQVYLLFLFLQRMRLRDHPNRFIRNVWTSYWNVISVVVDSLDLCLPLIRFQNRCHL